MKPTEIYSVLRQDVIGQEESLRYVAVAIFKHLSGEKFGNLLLIGNSGTGKTTIMRAMERLYTGHPEFADYRVVIIMNASTLATEDGIVDSHRLFQRLEERARMILGPDASPEALARLMERATVCLDEIDKVSGIVGGKPYVTGINIQQTLLTLIEGERATYPLASERGGRSERVSVQLDTSKMLFLCAGAFESLYDLVFKRVTSPSSRVKLPTTTIFADGKVEVREYFTLKHHFRQEDLFDYGMQPQFLSRFDSAIILEDLDANLLARIFREPDDSIFRASQSFFSKYGIELSISEGAVRRIADEASKSARIGARALKGVYGKVIKPFEFDPFGQSEVQQAAAGHRLLIDEEVVGKALRPLY